jgi:uncharacterized protein YjbJ (UPF0337 family)
MTVAISKDTPKQTVARFKKEERAREGAEAMLEYEAEGRAVREKTARLRTLRLAAEAGKKDAGIEAAVKQAKGSVKKAASKVTRGAKLEAKGKLAKAVGKKHALTKTCLGSARVCRSRQRLSQRSRAELARAPDSACGGHGPSGHGPSVGG